MKVGSERESASSDNVADFRPDFGVDEIAGFHCLFSPRGPPKSMDFIGDNVPKLAAMKSVDLWCQRWDSIEANLRQWNLTPIIIR